VAVSEVESLIRLVELTRTQLNQPKKPREIGHGVPGRLNLMFFLQRPLRLDFGFDVSHVFRHDT
jgi:hypothetical protein